MSADNEDIAAPKIKGIQTIHETSICEEGKTQINVLMKKA
jgi:hypothetical protein